MLAIREKWNLRLALMVILQGRCWQAPSPNGYLTRGCWQAPNPNGYPTRGCWQAPNPNGYPTRGVLAGQYPYIGRRLGVRRPNYTLPGLELSLQGYSSTVAGWPAVLRQKQSAASAGGSLVALPVTHVASPLRARTRCGWAPAGQEVCAILAQLLRACGT